MKATSMVVVSLASSGELELPEAACLSSAEALSQLGSSADGLSSADATQRLRQFGPNALGTRRVRAVAVVLRQLRNPILILLLGAALVSGLTGGGTNALIIAVIVALSVGLGFFNEYRAEMAMAAAVVGQQLPGPGRFLLAVARQSDVHPAGEQIAGIPLTLPVPQDH